MLFLDESLCKGKRGPQPGSQRGGNYIARVMVDGKPRYFTTQDEYDSYLSNKKRAKKEEGTKQLKEKLGREHTESKEKEKRSEGLLGKSLYLDLNWGVSTVPLILGDNK